jgi:hypothetical protein
MVLYRIARDKVRVRLVWRGGLSTTADLRVRGANFAHLSDDAGPPTSWP